MCRALIAFFTGTGARKNRSNRTFISARSSSSRACHVESIVKSAPVCAPEGHRACAVFGRLENPAFDIIASEILMNGECSFLRSFSFARETEYVTLSLIRRCVGLLLALCLDIHCFLYYYFFSFFFFLLTTRVNNIVSSM